MLLPEPRFNIGASISAKNREDKTSSIIGMKDIDGTYILSILLFDQGIELTSSLLSSILDYSEIKNVLNYDYLMLKQIEHLRRTRGINIWRDVTSTKREHLIFTADELDQICETYTHKHAYIFYPKERIWRIYQLPQQELITQFP